MSHQLAAQRQLRKRISQYDKNDACDIPSGRVSRPPRQVIAYSDAESYIVLSTTNVVMWVE